MRWRDVDTAAGWLHVRTQVDQKGRRGVPKTPTAVRSVVLSPQLGRLLAEHRLASPFSGDDDPVFASEQGTPLGHDNVRKRGVEPAVKRAGLDDPGRPKITPHSFRDTFASTLIIDLRLDVVQVSRLLGHANPAITAKTYARMFDAARHGDAVRSAMEASALGAAMEPRGTVRNHVLLPARTRSHSRPGERRRKCCIYAGSVPSRALVCPQVRALAMQKVVGSSPIIRSNEGPEARAFFVALIERFPVATETVSSPGVEERSVTNCGVSRMSAVVQRRMLDRR